MVMTAADLRIKIFADGADRRGIAEHAENPFVKGFTTNPTLMRKAGISDYESFAREILTLVTDRPVSFEVFSDEFDEMEMQALKIASWGPNVVVKIPVTTTKGESCAKLLSRLARSGVALNVTALMTLKQIRTVTESLEGGAPSIVSVFAGRMADAGVDPVPMMAAGLELCRAYDNIELLWASPREVLNIVQANQIGCDIITVTNDLLAKLGGLGKDLDAFSLETVKMFADDAATAGFAL
jgi:transaldolase